MIAALFVMISAQFASAQMAGKTTALKTFTLSDGRFSIDLPGEPTHETETKDGVTTNTYTFEDEDNIFSVVEMTAPGIEKLLAESPTMLQALSNSFFTGIIEESNKTSEVEGSLEEVRSITHKGMDGKELNVTISGFPVKARVLAAKNAVYMFTFFEGEVVEADLIDKILGSFKVNEPKITAK